MSTAQIVALAYSDAAAIAMRRFRDALVSITTATDFFSDLLLFFTVGLLRPRAFLEKALQVSCFQCEAREVAELSSNGGRGVRRACLQRRDRAAHGALSKP